MCPAVVAILFGQFVEVGADDLKHFMGVGKDVFKLGNSFEQGLIFVLNFLAFKGSQTAQLHIEDCLSLDFGEVEAGHQI